MRYLLAVYQPDGVSPPPASLERIMKNVRAVREEMKEAGVWIFTAGLYPPARAKVVRPAPEGFFVTDGPFAETKEHIGGFLIIDAADDTAATAWARKFAQATTLPIEVRPLRNDEDV
ncbi:MAG TPA: YciI family protein [Vicinamibacterales bacterium]